MLTRWKDTSSFCKHVRYPRSLPSLRVVITTSPPIRFRFSVGPPEANLLWRAYRPLFYLDDHTKTPALLVSTEDRARLHDLFRTFRRLGRLLVPSEEVYEDAGRLLRQLQSVHGYRLRHAHSLTHDVLIALSARAIGGTVVTQN